jgi:AcrR family transcriptional regulator
MDDVARELAISKKTLYEFVSDKNELVEKVIDYDIFMHKKYFQCLREKKLNSIDELLQLYEVLDSMLKDYNTSMEYDLKKYYPSAYETLTAKSRQYMSKYLIQNLSKGIKEGFFRKDINVDVISKLVIMRIENMHNTGIFTPEEFHSKEVFHQLLKYHLFAICSPKGLKYIKERI